MKVVLGLDIGTTYFKCVVVSESGDLLGVSREAVKPAHPLPGYAELPFRTFRHLLKAVIEDSLTIAGCVASDVVSISYASQANTFALFDNEMSPLTPIVLWTDERSVDGTVSESESYAFLKTRQVDDRSLPVKLLWFRKSSPAVWAKTEHVLTISETMVYLLTGEIAVDAATASLTGLLSDCFTSYDPECMETLKLRDSMLSRVLLPGTQIARAAGSLAEEIGLLPSTILVAGNLDHVSAAIGAGIGQVAPVSVSIGTVLAVMEVRKGYPCSQLVHPDGSITVPYLRPDSCFRLLARDMGASTLEWYRSTFAAKKSFAQLTEEARIVPPGCDGLAVRPHVAHNLGKSASIFSGSPNSSAGSDDGRFVRAIMEFTAATLGDLFDVVLAEPGPRMVVVTGGGSRSAVWLQIVADMTGVSVTRLEVEESAAFGAAMHAAAGAKWCSKIEGFAKARIRSADTFVPSVETSKAYKAWKESSHEYAKRITSHFPS